ncbi:HAD-IA family hydrolase [Alkalibaculum sp. M08DMB]|uniref:HAD-IA family hydrolase n=1 Tax=Alkalibaculum sporogenes TaxID=2655001 RepID=A0A6A7KAU2_9FIRM|nr:HAD-IA family hydrolase [Alkalibaculum sporogenes]
MSKYKGIIFDLDGTLLNTIDDLSDSVNEVISSYGYPKHCTDSYKMKIGRGFRDLIENSFPKGTQEKIINDGLQLFMEIYGTKYMNKTTPYSGIDRLLDNLNNRDFKIGVNSNKRTEYAKQLITKFFKRIPFVEIFGERESVPKKPDPAAALEIAELMQLLPQEILYVGDSKTDILTAKNARMDSIGVLWGFTSYEKLSKYNATYMVSNSEEILAIATN